MDKRIIGNILSVNERQDRLFQSNDKDNGLEKIHCLKITQKTFKGTEGNYCYMCAEMLQGDCSGQHGHNNASRLVICRDVSILHEKHICACIWPARCFFGHYLIRSEDYAIKYPLCTIKEMTKSANYAIVLCRASLAKQNVINVPSFARRPG